MPMGLGRLSLGFLPTLTNCVKSAIRVVHGGTIELDPLEFR